MIPQVHLEEYSKELDAEIKSTEEKIRSLQSQARRPADAKGCGELPGADRPAGHWPKHLNGNPSSGSRATHWATSTHPHRRTVPETVPVSKRCTPNMTNHSWNLLLDWVERAVLKRCCGV